MLARPGLTAMLVCALVAPVSAQVVRFETTIGNFDMVLNPTSNSRLQGHVDNLLAYVNDNRYNGSWINRADTGFVLQMGSFFSHTQRPPMTVASTRPVDSFAPIQGEPAITFNGLSNTVGTVSLALPAGNIDGGTSSFFVNIGSNTGLDGEFTVFAAIPDMTVVNQIMALTKLDRTTDPLFGAGPGNLAYTDVPVQADGKQIFINRAFVVTDAMSVARANAGVQSAVALSQAVAAGEVASDTVFAPGAVPEPASAAMALVATLAANLVGRRRRRC